MRGQSERRVDLTPCEREAVLQIIGKLSETARAVGWTVINGARVDALASAAEKLKVADDD